VSDTEKREKKMLEKKLTEMEEELKVTTVFLLLFPSLFLREDNAKCRYQKKFTCKGTLRQVLKQTIL
jgi:hypothetical protein